MKYAVVLSTFLFTLCVLPACSPGLGTSVASSENARTEAALFEKYSSFGEAVRAQPKLMVRGNQAYLRNATASTGTGATSTEVQFAVSGQVIGTLSDCENAIALQDIDRLRVLDSREASAIYGLRGANGIVEIVTIK